MDINVGPQVQQLLQTGQMLHLQQQSVNHYNWLKYFETATVNMRTQIRFLHSDPDPGPDPRSKIFVFKETVQTDFQEIFHKYYSMAIL